MTRIISLRNVFFAEIEDMNCCYNRCIASILDIIFLSIPPLIPEHGLNVLVMWICVEKIRMILFQFIPHGTSKKRHGVLIRMESVHGFDELPNFSTDIDPVPRHVEDGTLFHGNVQVTPLVVLIVHGLPESPSNVIGPI